MTGFRALIVCALTVAASTLGGLVWTSDVSARGQDIRPEWMLQGRSDYLENCAGCHGVDGRSAPAQVPELKGRVGYFMCNEEARDYLIRLPNVAHVAIPDPQDLANLVNYMVFALGEDSVPRDAKPFAAEEVAELRKHPLHNQSLVAERARLVEELVRECGAPASLSEFYDDALGPALK